MLPSASKYLAGGAEATITLLGLKNGFSTVITISGRGSAGFTAGLGLKIEFVGGSFSSSNGRELVRDSSL